MAGCLEIFAEDDDRGLLRQAAHKAAAVEDTVSEDVLHAEDAASEDEAEDQANGAVFRGGLRGAGFADGRLLRLCEILEGLGLFGEARLVAAQGIFNVLLLVGDIDDFRIQSCAVFGDA